jgi:hypothetical protein
MTLVLYQAPYVASPVRAAFGSRSPPLRPISISIVSTIGAIH